MAQVIRQQKADVVGLTEVENRDVVDLIRGYLGKGWKVVFKKAVIPAPARTSPFCIG